MFRESWFPGTLGVDIIAKIDDKTQLIRLRFTTPFDASIRYSYLLK